MRRFVSDYGRAALDFDIPLSTGRDRLEASSLTNLRTLEKTLARLVRTMVHRKHCSGLVEGAYLYHRHPCPSAEEAAAAIGCYRDAIDC